MLYAYSTGPLSRLHMRGMVYCTPTRRIYTYALGVIHGAEKSGEYHLTGSNLDGRQVRQIVFERPLLLQHGVAKAL